MNILVTGGAGFIGSNFLHFVNERYPSYKLFCIDSLTYAGNLNNIDRLIQHGLVSFYKGDIRDAKFLSEFFETHTVDQIINFAAESHVDRSISDPQLFITTNYIGVLNLLNEVRKNPSMKFHQVSTDEVFGDLPLDQPELKFEESSKFKPSSPYSASKAAADLLVLAFFRTYKIPVTISHASNNYGPFQFPEKLIPLVIHRAQNNIDIPVYGDGKNVRDWLYVEDHCEAIMEIIHHGRAGETYNIGGECEISNIEIVKEILFRMNKTESLISFVADRPGHDRRYAVSIDKIIQDFGWKPKHSFEVGVTKTINWYLSNSEWMKSVVNKDYQNYIIKQYETK